MVRIEEHRQLVPRRETGYIQTIDEDRESVTGKGLEYTRSGRCAIRGRCSRGRRRGPGKASRPRRIHRAKEAGQGRSDRRSNL